MKVVKNIDIYLTSKRPVRTIDVVQYDTGVQLVFTAKDFTIPSGSTATLYVQKPSGKFVYQNFNITVAINTITIDLENQALTEYGEIPYQVSIENGTDTVTTFTGLMLVERKLSDAGATESKTVVRAFDELTVEKLAEFQTRAETAARGVIATIPEDYTEMTAKVNGLANAIKGSLSGAVVRADDVSPVEHLPVVKVHGKNRLNISEMISNNLVSNGDGSFTLTKNSASSRFSEYATLSIPASTKVIVSIKSYNGSSTCVYIQFFLTDGTTKSVSLDKENLSKATIFNLPVNKVRLYISNEETDGASVTFENMQIEIGTTATEYTPYVDPSTVTVTRCGKNMLNIRTVNVQAVSGVTFSFDEEGKCTVSGTNSEENIIHVYATTSVSGIVIPKGTTVTVSGLPDNRKCCLRVFTNTTIGNTVGGLQGDYYETQTITVTEDTIIQNVLIRVAGGATVNAVFKPMLEIGDTATEFERFKELVKYTPNADGTIEGITSVAPTMTLLTDTEGVTVECEYNKDTNKVISKLADALGITI